MDDFGMLARDFGFRPQGKSAPMAASRGNNNNARTASNLGIGSGGAADHTRSSPRKSSSVFSDHDRGGGGSDGLLFDDVFGGPPKYTADARGGGGSVRSSSSSSAFNYDSSFQASKSSSLPPVYDKPVYDDDIFDGLPGLKSPSGSANKYEDVFGSLSSTPSRQKNSSQFDDLLGNLARKGPEPKSARERVEKDTPAFDDLLPGFGGSSSPMRRPTSESNRSHKPSSSSTKMTSNVMEDPFVVLQSTSTPVSSSTPVSPSGLFTDPLEEISKLSSSGSTKVDRSPVSGGVFDDIDPLDRLGKSVPPVSSDFNHRVKDRSPMRTGPSMSGAQSPVRKEQTSKFPSENFENHSQKKDHFNNSNASTDFHRSVGQATSPPSYASSRLNEMNSHIDTSPRHEENLETSGEVWLTVSEVPLFTQPTSVPPPSRPPPPRPARVSKSETRSFGSTNTRNKVNEFSSFSNSTQYSYTPKSARASTTSPVASQIDELENFAMGKTQNNVNEHEDVEANSDAAASAALMKEAMDRAEAKFRHAREVREREHQKTARSRETVQLEKDEKTMQDAQEKELRQERLDRERQQREREEEEREQRRLEKEREQRRLERERERAREIEREREKARKAVERATREARERAAAEARLKAERAAVEKAQAEARERAERAAVQRAQAEARERAAAEAKERAEKVAAEARERGARERASASRAEAESRLRADRAAAERAAAEARERAAAAARGNQQTNDNDLESFFSMGNRPSSAPRPRANSSDPLFDTQAQSKGGPEPARRTSVGASSNIRKASSSTNIVDDLTSIFGAAPSSGDFQDIEGESEERRRARLERHQRTQERAAKALAEKNNRDLQAQREQAERHRIAETLDVEIKRWAAGKEANLRALLSTLQYVLWPECGWQPVSLTDMITAAQVKKVYRKATLCIHPDKVQQKGANLQQKYIAEKVFDLLKEAWNKFNSEELF